MQYTHGRRPNRVEQPEIYAQGAFKMNNDIVAGNWKQLKGKVKETWGKLTDDDLDAAAGRRDQIVGKIQERYGIAKDEAERQMKQFEDANVRAKATIEKR